MRGLVAVVLLSALPVAPAARAAEEAAPPAAKAPAAGAPASPPAASVPTPPPPTAPAPQTAPAAAEEGPQTTPLTDYPVRLGDTIRLSVWGEPGLSGEAVVMPDGTISLPMVGTVQVLGKTVPAITEEVVQAYRRYFKDPKISLSCVPKTPAQVYFGGAVARPGPIDFDPRLRLLDYLGMAGGPTVGADLTRVVITSVSGAQTTRSAFDLGDAKPGMEPARNPYLRPGDTVWIGKSLPVSVVGAVARPGSFDFQQSLRLSDYLGMAGGPTDQAKAKKAVLKRTGEEKVQTIDLRKALEKPDSPELNPILGPGDVVTVPVEPVGGNLSWSDVLHSITTAVFWWAR